MRVSYSFFLFTVDQKLCLATYTMPVLLQTSYTRPPTNFLILSCCPRSNIPNILVIVCPLTVERSFPIRPFVRVSSKIVPLSLSHIRRKRCPPIRVVVPQTCTERRTSHSASHTQCYNPPPRPVPRVQLRSNFGINHKIREVFICRERRLDLSEESCTDDASPPPQAGAQREVHIPSKVIGRRPDQPHALCIAHQLGTVDSGGQIFYNLIVGHARYLGGSRKDGRGGYTFVLAGRKIACIERRSDRGTSYGLLRRLLDGPSTRSLGSGFVEDAI
mmetsp:Transcript_19698/g.39194  ORF Transcript_19698/g.39194 Transcript_19698/m.39194 type:complete len:274 (+) Transcript_19698:88-909(+)